MHQITTAISGFAQAAVHSAEVALGSARGAEKKAWAIDYVEHLVDAYLKAHGLGWADGIANRLIDGAVELAFAEVERVLGGFPQP